MKIIKYILALTLFVGFVSSCDESKKVDDSPKENSKEEHHHDHDEEIVLNNGKKWIVVEEMMAHIQNMENEIDQFSGDDYPKLAKSLSKHIDLLTSNCTMTGQAHDELHKWLLPYIDMVDELSNAKDKAESAEVFEKIQQSFKEFNTYFE